METRRATLSSAFAFGLLFITLTTFSILFSGSPGDRSGRLLRVGVAFAVLLAGIGMAVLLVGFVQTFLEFALVGIIVGPLSWKRREDAPMFGIKPALFSWVAMVALGAAILAIAPLVLVPKVTVVNDRDVTVKIGTCTRQEFLDPGEAITIRPSRPCAVFEDIDSYSGCLDIPDETILDSGEVRLSASDPSIAEADCRATDRFSRLSPVRQW